MKEIKWNNKALKNLEKLELLLPAGDLVKLKYAFKFGADAVYIGLPYYSLRIKENKFNFQKLIEGIKYAKKIDKKIYITANIYPRKGFNEKNFLNVVDEIYSQGADALIMSDPGLINLVKENFDIPIHLSVQANATNYLAVKFWKKFGVSRVILPRELILEEINFISDKVPDIELEFFVHGSICMAYSGRCLISAYLNKRHANLGQCTNSCRWKYRVWLEEEKRKGQLMLVEEDEKGTYFFNSRDYCLIERLPDLINAGIVSFKVEGRNKSEYYVAIVAKAYRKALDLLKKGEEPNWKELIKELESAPHRPWLTNFMNEPDSPWLQAYDYSTTIQTHTYLAHLIEGKTKIIDGSLFFKANIKNKIVKGQIIEVVKTNKISKAKIEEIFRVVYENENKERLIKEESISGGQEGYLLIKPLENEVLEGYELLRIKKKK